MIRATSATVALTAFIVLVFVLICGLLEQNPFGIPAELNDFTPPALISGRP